MGESTVGGTICGGRHFETLLWEEDNKETRVLTTSGVEAPSVCVVSAEARPAAAAAALLFESPVPMSGLGPSLSSITKSIGILPFKHDMYRWQKLSHSSCT